MIKFEDEIKRFEYSPEIEDAEELIQNQDLDDLADVVIQIYRDARAEGFVGRRMAQPASDAMY